MQVSAENWAQEGELDEFDLEQIQVFSSHCLKAQYSAEYQPYFFLSNVLERVTDLQMFLKKEN